MKLFLLENSIYIMRTFLDKTVLEEFFLEVTFCRSFLDKNARKFSINILAQLRFVFRTFQILETLLYVSTLCSFYFNCCSILTMINNILFPRGKT